MENEDLSLHFGKKLKTALRIYENPTENSAIRQNQFHVLKSLKLGKIVRFGNFARIESICVGFHLGTLHGYLFH